MEYLSLFFFSESLLFYYIPEGGGVMEILKKRMVRWNGTQRKHEHLEHLQHIRTLLPKQLFSLGASPEELDHAWFDAFLHRLSVCGSWTGHYSFNGNVCDIFRDRTGGEYHGSVGPDAPEESLVWSFSHQETPGQPGGVRHDGGVCLHAG